MVNRPGNFFATAAWTWPTIASSPSWVLAASHTGREPMASCTASRSAAVAGNGAAAVLRLPDTVTLAAPRSRSRAAMVSSCASTSEKLDSSRWARPRARCQPVCESAEMRALSSTMGMPRAAVSSSRFGHNSDSTQIARLGCQYLRKRRTQAGRSTGTNWCRARFGRRSPIRLADVTVPVVIRILSVGRSRVSRPISTRTDCASPMLAAWSHSSGPSGRCSEATPRRSSMRAGSSLPRAMRRRSSNWISGRPAVVSPR